MVLFACEYNRLMKINVSHVAKLANLPLSDEEKKKFEKQLEETLAYVDQLKEVSTEKTPATSQVTGLENVLREDEIKPSLTQEQTLKNAKKTHNGFFVVPAILDNQ